MKILDQARHLLHLDKQQPSELSVQPGQTVPVKRNIVLHTPMDGGQLRVRLTNRELDKPFPREVNAEILGAYKLEYKDVPKGLDPERFEVELKLDGKLYRVRDDMPMGYLHLKLDFEPDGSMRVILDNLRFEGGVLRPHDASEATEAQTKFTDSRPVQLRTGERNDHLAMVTALTGKDPITGE